MSKLLCSFLLVITMKEMFVTAAVSKGRTSIVRGVSETADKLANMTVSARRQSMGAPPMIAGGHWISGSRNLLMRPTQEISATRVYPKKVAG